MIINNINSAHLTRETQDFESLHGMRRHLYYWIHTKILSADTKVETQNLASHKQNIIHVHQQSKHLLTVFRLLHFSHAPIPLSGVASLSDTVRYIIYKTL